MKPSGARSVSRRHFLQGAAALCGAACRRQDEAAGRTVASLWFTYGGRNRQVLERLVARFNTSQSSYFVRAVYQGDYFEGLAKLRTAVAARSGPSFSHVVGEVVPYLFEAQVLEPLDDYPGAGELGILHALGQAGSFLGGSRRPLVALPFNRSTPIAYLNGQIFEQARLAAPTSWDTLREVARRLTVRRGGRVVRHGFGCPIDWWFWVALVGQAGGRIVDAAGRVTLGGDAAVQALELWQDLVQREGSMKPPPGRDYNAWEQTNQDFLAGRTAMIWTSTAFLKYLEENAPFPVVAAPLPKHVERAVPTGGTHWIVLRQAPEHEKRAAWAFLRFMHEPEQVIEWATETGYLPVTEAAIARLERDGYFARHPNAKVALDQLAVAMPWPWSTELFRIQREIVQPRLESAVLSGANAARLIEQARALIEGQSG
ncbi:MAG TPA: ABC transporter substrate-binding protein [Polyangiaceae bacterium]|nr:ABC transporter substrate-binding protein [Polyangiaceae bacterium]